MTIRGSDTRGQVRINIEVIAIIYGTRFDWYKYG